MRTEKDAVPNWANVNPLELKRLLAEIIGRLNSLENDMSEVKRDVTELYNKS